MKRSAATTGVAQTTSKEGTVSETDDMEFEDENDSRKRKPEKDDPNSELLRNLMLMFDSVGKLGEQVLGEKKIKRSELKQSFDKLSDCVKTIEEKKLLLYLEDSKQASNKKKRVVCYRCSSEIESEKKDCCSAETRNMMEKIKSGNGSLSVVKNVIERDWPPDIYRKSSVKVGNPLVPNQSPDTVVFLKDGKAKSGIIDTAKVIYPELEDILVNDLKPGETCYVENLSVTKKGSTGKKRLYTIAGEQTEDLVNALKELIDELAKTGSKQIVVAVIEEERRDGVRKLMELAMLNTDGKIDFFVPSLPTNKMKNSARQPKDTEVIIIKPSSTSSLSYADISKAMKEVVFPDALGVNIKKVVKHKVDSIMITTKKGEAEKLKTEILARNRTELVVNIPKEERILVITGIDALVEKEDVETGITKALGVQGLNLGLEIKTLRPARNGTQVSEIVVSQEFYFKLMDIKKIKIGWTLCQIEKRVFIPRCYNYLRMGHISKNCAQEKSEDKRCFNCMETGHTTQIAHNAKRGATDQTQWLALNIEKEETKQRANKSK